MNFCDEAWASPGLVALFRNTSPRCSATPHHRFERLRHKVAPHSSTYPLFCCKKTTEWYKISTKWEEVVCGESHNFNFERSL